MTDQTEKHHTIIKNEINNFKLTGASIQPLSIKDEVVVYHVTCDQGSYVLKYFYHPEHKREMFYYKLLNSLGVKTIKIINQSEDALLMEDINHHASYRLASPEDLNNKKVVMALVKYYQRLHLLGKAYFKASPDTFFYSEINCITRDELLSVAKHTCYNDDEFWCRLNAFIDYVKPFYMANRTLTYNDFYHGNLIVSKDLTEAFVFDYNYFGVGLVYFDISNVTSALNDEMTDLFISTYGTYNSIEKDINFIVSHVFSLITAYKRKTFPSWAQESLDLLLSGHLKQYLETFDYHQLETGLNKLEGVSYE